MLNETAPRSQDVRIVRHRLVQILDPIAALTVRHLTAPAGNMVQTGGEIRQVGTHENHALAPVFVAVGDLETLNGVMPEHTPSHTLWDLEAGNLRPILECRA